MSFSHEPGEYDGPLTVELSAEDPEAEVRYTLDGSDPAAHSALIYNEPLLLTDSATVRAVSIGPGGAVSAESVAEYTLIKHRLDAPDIQHGGGAFTEPQTVTLESSEPDAVIRYTLDGTTPSATNGLTYSGPLTVEESATLKAVASRPGWLDSEVREATFRIFGNLVESTEDIVLGPGEEMVIEDTLFRHTGNITLSGDARLVIRDSLLQHVKDFAFQYSLTASGDSVVIVENSGIGTNCTGSFNWNFFDDAKLIADGMDPAYTGCNIWHFMSGSSSIEVADWDTFSGTVCDGASLTVADSEGMEIEFCFPESSTIDTSLPTEIDHFSLEPDPENNIEFSFTADNSTVDGWGINVLYGSDITIRDTEAITIGVIVGRPWEEETVVVEGLEKRVYEDQTWQIGDNASLRLVNTYVYGWEPNVFADNSLTIRDSDYSGSAVNSGDAQYVIENSRIGQLVAHERVRMTVRDSVITGDVIANEDSEIILINCTVEGTVHGDERAGGNVYARGNGRVVLQGTTTVLGETETQDNGEIVQEEG